jgi:glycosyltransferase involved in cell wall biosynthesis
MQPDCSVVDSGFPVFSKLMSKPLRIAIDARPALWPTMGIGTIVRNVILRIQVIDPNNDYLFYFDRDPAALAERLKPAPCSFDSQQNKLLWANSYMRKRLVQDKIDVYVSFLDKEIPFLSSRAKILCMVHDLIPLRFPETVFRNVLHKIYYSLLIRAAVARADLVLTNSEFSKREIMECLHTRDNKLRKLTLGVSRPQEQDASGDRKFLQDLGLAGHYLVAIGSTEPRKNNERVLQAFRALSEKYANLHLVIVGKEWRGVKFDPKLLNDRTVLTGYVSDDAVDKLLRNAAALVFPSLQEGFGFPVLEAMAWGTPVITSSGTAIPEVGGDAVIYVDPRNVEEIRSAMQRLLDDSSLRSQLSQKGQERAKKFQWEATCRELAAIIAEVCSRSHL